MNKTVNSFCLVNMSLIIFIANWRMKGESQESATDGQ